MTLMFLATQQSFGFYQQIPPGSWVTFNDQKELQKSEESGKTVHSICCKHSELDRRYSVTHPELPIHRWVANPMSSCYGFQTSMLGQKSNEATLLTASTYNARYKARIAYT